MSISPSKKVLVPLATLLVAGAVAVGSGATFTSETNNTASSFTTGTLKHTNSKADKAIFDLANLKPGDTLNGSLVITNTGTLPAAFGLTEVLSTNNFTVPSLLKLKITNSTTGAVVYNDTFGGLVDGAKTELGTVTAGTANTYVFSVTLDSSATNAEQGKSATATYKWDSVQLAGDTINQ
jgi:spore coat-associated protein N